MGQTAAGIDREAFDFSGVEKLCEAPTREGSARDAGHATWGGKPTVANSGSAVGAIVL
jgi:hypothetical protein